MSRPSPKSLRAGPAVKALRRQVRELRQRVAKVERRCSRCRGETTDVIGFQVAQGGEGTC